VLDTPDVFGQVNRTMHAPILIEAGRTICA
jgi:hypothetical protein